MTSTSRRPHIIRLAAFVAFLLVMFYLLAVKHVVNIEDVRGWVKATGPLAPLTYIVLSAALASYAFGAFGVPLWQMAAGAFIGSVPRAFVYTALGASLGNKSPALAYAAIGVWCVTAVAGAFAARQGLRKWRGHDGQDSAEVPPVTPPTH